MTIQFFRSFSNLSCGYQYVHSGPKAGIPRATSNY